MKTKTVYWIVTGLFAAFMLFSAIPDLLVVEEAVKFMSHLGYPDYFVPFIGLAKILGCVAILVPSFVRLKEWAYAGLFFDLIGAVYSVVAVDGFHPSMLIMVLPISFLFYSRYLGQKMRSINN